CLPSVVADLPLIIFVFLYCSRHHRHLDSFPTRRSSDLAFKIRMTIFTKRLPDCVRVVVISRRLRQQENVFVRLGWSIPNTFLLRSEEHTSELQSRENLVCRLLVEKKKKNTKKRI